MSSYKVKNPLDEFQSHSFHYVVIASKSTEDLRGFTDNTPEGMSKALTAINQVKSLGGAIGLDLNGQMSTGVLLLDTRRFSQFTVEAFNLKTLINGFTVQGSSSPNATALELNMTIIDSIGISFANYLQYVMDDVLQVSFDGMFLLIKIIFIGHKADGDTEVINTIAIPAIFNEIKMDLTEVRGFYECTLFPITGLVSTNSYNQRWTQIGTASSFFTGTGKNTLGDMVKSFETALNEKSRESFLKHNFDIAKAGGYDPSRFNRYGRLVQYMITLPNSWYNFKFFGAVQNSRSETDFKQLLEQLEKQKNKPQSESLTPDQQSGESYMSVDSSFSITDVLDLMFKQVPEILELGNFKNPWENTKEIKFYKQIISITSDAHSYVVHVDVVEFTVPNIKIKNNVAENPEFCEKKIDTYGAEILVPKNYLEYNYNFSGVNVDVLNLEIKIENLNYLLLSEVKLGSLSVDNKTNEGQNQANGVSEVTKKVRVNFRKNDPVFIPLHTKDQRTNFSTIPNIKQTGKTMQQMLQEYTHNVAAFYNGSPNQVLMTIRGNPDLMSGVVLTQLASHQSGVSFMPNGNSLMDESSRKTYREQFERNLKLNSSLLTGTSFIASPVFVKVNIHGPNVEFINNELVDGEDYSRLLFENNFYYLSQIESKIQSSKFLQEFQLLSYNVYEFPEGI